MTPDFRDQLSRDWRMQRMWTAIADYREAVQIAELTAYRELRPPCRKCGQWPCVCEP